MKSNNFIGISLLLVVIYFAFRPAPPTSAQTAEIQTQIGTGIPVLLEFQSPY